MTLVLIHAQDGLILGSHRADNVTPDDVARMMARLDGAYVTIVHA